MPGIKLLSQLGQRAKSLIEKSFSAKHLYLTNTLSCGVLLAVGDFLEQRLEKSLGKTHKYDDARTGRMFLVGLSQGPPHHIWYTYLDKLLPRRDLRTVCLKILADQIVAAPFFAVTFFYGMGILQGKSLSECWSEFCKKFPAVYMFDWLIWPPTQFINFVWVPPKFRVFYVNLITVIWDIFLSYMKHFDQLEESNIEQEDEK